jgi:single-strand DNA-binding protein
MASFNKVFLMGNLTRDPELSYTTEGVPVCKFGLAVNKSFTTKQGEKKEDVLFIDITVWRKQAENCATYLKKGRQALVEGELKLDSWQSKEGEKRSKIKVVAQSVTFIGGAGESGSGGPGRATTGHTAEKGVTSEPEAPAEPNMNEPEEEVPF